MDQSLSDRLKELVLPLLSAQQVELVDLILRREGRKIILRFLVDKSAGITLDECAQLNREIGRILDEQDVIQERYVLEVSSPGLDRSLRSIRDFQRVQGQLIKIVLHQPLNKQNVWIGFVSGIDDENVTIRTEKKEMLSIPRNNIARANLEVRV